jgi:hypothetical protein
MGNGGLKSADETSQPERFKKYFNGNFSVHHRVQTGSGVNSACYTMGVKQPEREVDHSPPSSAEVKNAWNYNCIPPIRLHSAVLS